MVKKILPFLICCLLSLTPSPLVAEYLEPLGSGTKYGCSGISNRVYKHGAGGNHKLLKTKQVLAIMSRLGNSRSARRLRAELKACMDGKLTFRDPCTAVGTVVSTESVNAQMINGRACENATSSVVRVQVIGAGINCSGVVVHPQIVVTAAHCFGSYDGFEEQTAVVTTPLGQYESTHANYLGYFKYEREHFSLYDIGFVYFESPLDGVEVAPLLGPDTSLVPGELAVTAGYGRTESDITGSLNAGYTPITGADSRVITTTFPMDIGQSGTCHGDSGGPLMVKREGQWVVAGVTSGSDNAECGFANSLYFSHILQPEWLDMVKDSVCYYEGMNPNECPFFF